MFEKIFIEESAIQNPYTQKILSHFKNPPIFIIDNYREVFEKVKKPYLQKRETLNLFIAEKKGELVKLAPPAYGLEGVPHYYFVHAYNCIYECSYCYLQGYFHSPDLVMFVNHHEVIARMQEIYDEHMALATNEAEKEIWFHAGEYSDSLALSHITGEIELYFEFFKKNTFAKLELRTKSANIKVLEKLSPLPNIYVSFSLSTAKRNKDTELKTPPLTTRLKALHKLMVQGYKIGLHLDPIIYEDDFKNEYQKLINQIHDHIPASLVEYVSVGVVRFTKDVYHQVQKNYPDSLIHSQELVKGQNNLIRYNRPMRMWILNTIKQMLVDGGISSERVYLCMESLE